MIPTVSGVMKDRAHHSPTLLVAIALSIAFSSLVLAQEPPREKPRLKDFGSSLKRLKWDPKQNAAVEAKRSDDKATSDDVVRVETSLVVSDVLVLDQRGQPISGLTGKDFILTEDGRPQQVGMFSLGENAAVPRSIVLIIDYSSSQSPFINTSVAAAKILVDKLGPLDRMAIVTDDVELLLDFTRDRHKLNESLEALRERTTRRPHAAENSFPRFGRSAQYSALMATLKEAFDAEDQRPIIIFQTDGDEAYYLRNSIMVPSIPPNLPPDMQEEAQRNVDRVRKVQADRVREFGLQDIYKAAETSRATIYTVVPGLRLLGLSPDEQVAKLKNDYEQRLRARSQMDAGAALARLRKTEEDRLNRTPPEALRHEAAQQAKMQSALAVLSTITGGWIEFLEDPSQADEIYSHILSDINRRYIVGYYPTNKEHDGKRRKVKIEVRGHPEYLLMGRKSYFAPEPEQ
jgi:VWFA-related protein